MPKREVDYNKDNKLVVSNNYIRAVHPDRMGLNAMKLFRLVITQCRLKDEEFFEYDFKISELAKLFEISSQNLYRDVREMCKNMLQMLLYIGDGNENHSWEYKTIFRTCKYDRDTGTITVRLNDDMTDLFLQLKRDFTRIPIAAVLMMRSKYAIRLFEVICEKLHSHFPYADTATEISLTIEEIRKATRTDDKKAYDILTNLKKRILEPSIAEIEAAADWKIIVNDIKRGRKVTGFILEIWSRNGWEVTEKYKREGKLPPWMGQEDLPGQMSIFDL